MEDSTQTAVTVTTTGEATGETTSEATPAVAATITAADSIAAPIQTPATPVKAVAVPTTIQTEPVSTVPASKHISTFGVMAIVLVLIAAGTGGYFASKYLKANMNGGEESQVQVESTVLQDTNIIDESLTMPKTTVADQMPAVQTETQDEAQVETQKTKTQTEAQVTESATSAPDETAKVKRK